jgi:glyoxylase-like metal-dependent hydrolase (beta-lactamase superfamily II)
MLRPFVPWLVALLCACAPPRFAPVGPKSSDATTTIQQVQLMWSNVYLLRHGDAAAVVDAGSPPDRDKLYDALVHAGVHPRDLQLAILTHVHADHAGLAHLLQLYGAKVVIGEGDVAVAAAGMNNPLKPTSLLASALVPLFMFPFDPFTPDIVVGDKEIDLAAYGFPDVRVVEMPGHTPGSLVILVGQKEAIVGDMMIGGWFGGVLYAHSAGEHYYQWDKKRNHANVAALLARGIQRFYIGHGGPLDRPTVESWLRGVDKKLVPETGGVAK